MKRLIMSGGMAALIALAAVAEVGQQNPLPIVSDVTMRQIDATREVEITYKLSAAPAIITLAIEVDGVLIVDSAVTTLSGAVCQVVNPDVESKKIVWHAGVDWPENITEHAVAHVTAYRLDSPPQYCAVDLIMGNSAENFPVYFYPSADGVPNGVSNELYKTTRLLLRRIEATPGVGYTIGTPAGETGRTDLREGQAQIVLTKPYYFGVYQLTQRQFILVSPSGTNESKFKHVDYKDTRPVEFVSYRQLRESGTASGTNPDYSWPHKGYAVAPESFMGILREKTGGILLFDLPTEAQWEWAARAGTTGALNDGTENISSTTRDANLDLLGRYKHNGGDLGEIEEKDATTNGTVAVGSYLPNAWGIYDIHGNVDEWCLDWYTHDRASGLDPVGPAEGDSGHRVRRRGSWTSGANGCRSGVRNSKNPSSSGRSSDLGFRVAAMIPDVVAIE